MSFDSDRSNKVSSMLIFNVSDGGKNGEENEIKYYRTGL